MSAHRQPPLIPRTFDEIVPPFKAARCECGHVVGDHHSGGTGWPHPPRHGYCYVKGCECREFREDGARTPALAPHEPFDIEDAEA